MTNQTISTSPFQKILLLLFSILIIEIVLQLTSLGYSFFNEKPNHTLPNKSDIKIILCIGESTTDWGASDSYPSQLQIKLDAKFGPNTYFVINEGVAGTDTSKILETLDSKIRKYQPDFIITMMGINDFWSISSTDRFFDKIKLYKFIKIFINNAKLYANKKDLQIESTLPLAVATEKLVANDENINKTRGNEALNRKDYAEAEKYFSKAIRNRQISGNIYFDLAKAKLQLGKKNEAETYFDKYTSFVNTASALTEVGSFYYFKYGVFDNYGQKMARKYLNKSYILDPNHIETLKLLGCGYANNPPDRSKALIYLEKAYELGSRETDIIGSLADIYIYNKTFFKAEAYLKTALDTTNESSFSIWTRLINLYLTLKRFKEAELYVDMALKRYPNNRNLEDLQNEIFKALGQKIRNNDNRTSITVENFLSFQKTQNNYVEIAKLIQNYGIKHIVMQYPRRRIQELKEILKTFNNLIYVENKLNFESALKTKTYDDLFIDKFALDFGHFTLLGSQLISDQIILTMQAENALPRN